MLPPWSAPRRSSYTWRKRMKISTSKMAFVVFKQTKQLTQKSKNVVGFFFFKVHLVIVKMAPQLQVHYFIYPNTDIICLFLTCSQSICLLCAYCRTNIS